MYPLLWRGLGRGCEDGTLSVPTGHLPPREILVIKNEWFEIQTTRLILLTLYNEKSASAGRTFGMLWMNSLALS